MIYFMSGLLNGTLSVIGANYNNELKKKTDTKHAQNGAKVTSGYGWYRQHDRMLPVLLKNIYTHFDAVSRKLQ